MKKQRSLIAAAAVLVVLAVVYMLITREPAAKDDSQRSADAAAAQTAAAGESELNSERQGPTDLIPFDPAGFLSYRIEHLNSRLNDGGLTETESENASQAGEESFTLVPVGTESWQVAEYPAIPLEKGVGEAITAALDMLSAYDSLETDDSSVNPADFGFDAPEARVYLKTAEHELTLVLGNENPDGTARYLMREDDSTIYLVRAYYTMMLFPTLYDIRIKMLAPVTVDQLKYITVDGPGEVGDYRFEQYETDDPFDPGLFQYFFTSPFNPPRGLRDPRFLERLQAAGSGLPVYGYIDEPDNLSDYGLDAEQATLVEVSAADGTGFKLLLGREAETEGQRYALAARTEKPVMLIAESDVSYADIEPFAYTERFAAIVGIDLIRGYTLETERLTVEAKIAREGEGEDIDETYAVNGKAVEEDPFKDFYQVIIGLQIEGIADPVAADAALGESPLLTITYKHAEIDAEKIVRLYPYNEDFTVLRINDGKPSFLLGRYQLEHLEEKAEVLLTAAE